MAYKTCVSIAEKTPKKLNSVLKTALKKSDYAELRFDFLKPIQIPDALELAKSNLVITDSGGLQKEAFWMGVPCVTMRENTEWVETIQEKGNRLFPLSKPVKIEKILQKFNQKFVPKKNLFGNGNSSAKIAKIIKSL